MAKLKVFGISLFILLVVLFGAQFLTPLLIFGAIALAGFGIGYGAAHVHSVRQSHRREIR